MRMQITATTDGKHVGVVVDFDPEASAIDLDGTRWAIEKVINLGKGAVRLANSNYVIDLVVVE